MEGNEPNLVDLPETILVSSSYEIIEVVAIYATAFPPQIRFHVIYKIGELQTESESQYYTPGNTGGLSDDLAVWLAENPEFPIQPYVPPTPEELRANMPSLARIDFRNKFRVNGITTAVINNYIAGIMDPDLQEERQIFWEDSQTFRRLDPFVVELGQAAGKTAEQIDTIWMS